MEAKFPFNVRVYGILINEKRELLVSDEFEYNIYFTKLPGGGLEYGEGLRDGLRREFREECEAEIAVREHFYTTDFFVKSAFGESQVISVYYQVQLLQPLMLEFKEKAFDFDGQESAGPEGNGKDDAGKQSFRWIPLSALRPEDMTFPIDRRVAELIIENTDSLL